MISSSAPASVGAAKRSAATSSFRLVSRPAGHRRAIPTSSSRRAWMGIGQDIPACRSGHARRRWFGGMVGEGIVHLRRIRDKLHLCPSDICLKFPSYCPLPAASSRSREASQAVPERVSRCAGQHGAPRRPTLRTGPARSQTLSAASRPSSCNNQGREPRATGKACRSYSATACSLGTVRDRSRTLVVGEQVQRGGASSSRSPSEDADLFYAEGRNVANRLSTSAKNWAKSASEATVRSATPGRRLQWS